MSNFDDLYQKFFKVIKGANSNVTPKYARQKATAEWNEAKNQFGNDKVGFSIHINKKIEKYSKKAKERSCKNLLRFFSTPKVFHKIFHDY